MSAVDGVDERLTSYGALFAVGGFPRLAASGFLVRTAAGMWQLALVHYSGIPVGSAVAGPLVAASFGLAFGLGAAFALTAAVLTYVLVPADHAEATGEGAAGS